MSLKLVECPETKKYSYFDPSLELTNLNETYKLIEYIFYRNNIIFDKKVIVDLGCGWGANTMLIACGFVKSGAFQVPKQVVGVDYNERDIKRATSFSKHLTNIGFICHDITKPFPFDDDSVDIFVSTYTLHNLDNDQKRRVFKEVVRTLKHKGFFIYIDVLFDRESQRYAILQKEILEKMWRTEAADVGPNEMETLLKVHLNPKDPFSLIFTGEKEYPITITEAQRLGEQEKLKVLSITSVKGLVCCKRIMFTKI